MDSEKIEKEEENLVNIEKEEENLWFLPFEELERRAIEQNSDQLKLVCLER